VTISTFSGGITNSGQITATNGAGILIGGTGNVTVANFSGGNISNFGTISAKTGIAIKGTTITGAIVDSGVILGTTHGIFIDGTSTINASHTAISVSGPTFTGGISKAGTLSAPGAVGILVSGVTTFGGGIVNSGLIDPATGIAVINVATYADGITNAAAGTITATNIGNVAGVDSRYTDPYGTGTTSQQYIPPRQVFGTITYNF